MTMRGWKDLSRQMWSGGPWFPDLILVELDGDTRTDIQIVVPKSTPVYETADLSKKAAERIALLAASNLLGWDIANGLVQVA